MEEKNKREGFGNAIVRDRFFSIVLLAFVVLLISLFLYQTFGKGVLMFLYNSFPGLIDTREAGTVLICCPSLLVLGLFSLALLRRAFRS
jgi:hypothetical protein